MNYGMKVKLRLKFPNDPDTYEMTLRNVTEIHYAYRAPLSFEPAPPIAFESCIHATGMIYKMSEITEMEVHPENTIQEQF
jgi:hypothetical protein